MVASDSSVRVSLAELVATLSLVADLGMGRPVERVLRQTVIAMRLGAVAGLDQATCASAYYTSLLTWVGCAAETSEVAALFGDETELYADTRDEDLGGVSLALFVARHLGRGKSGFRRIGMVGKFLASAGRSVQQMMMAHCQAASDFAGWLELGPPVCEPLLQAFERWDGRGVPGSAGAEGLAPAIRLVHLADLIEAFYHTGGTEAALRVARERQGTQFDPDLVDCFCARHREILDGLGDISAWDEVIALDPQLGAALTNDQLDRALAAFADFSDLKSPLRLGHSRGVAELAAQAGPMLGLSPADIVMLRRAALVHDIGMIGVPSGVWDEPGEWSVSQRERAWTHPYLTERMLARTPLLAQVGHCASLHHERLDGSGYPRGLRGEAISLPARILGAADAYNALRQPRPHRPALEAGDAERAMQDEVRAGRLDGEAVQAVLKAAGHRPRRRAGLPSGLTAREAEVLVRLGQGRSNPQIAAELHVSRKTVSSHLEHIYAKLGVKTRTEAALFAMRHGLIRTAANPGPDEKIGQLPDSLPPMDPYNGSMTTTADNHSTAAAPQFALAGSFLEGLAAQDFTKLSGALAPGIRLRALLPPGLMEWTGAEVIAGRFARWFGDTEDFELLEATVGEVGGRLHLHWRLRLRAERLGAGWFTVEQQVYADTDESGRIARLDLLCTGYRPEGGHG